MVWAISINVAPFRRHLHGVSARPAKALIQPSHQLAVVALGRDEDDGSAGAGNSA